MMSTATSTTSSRHLNDESVVIVFCDEEVLFAKNVRVNVRGAASGFALDRDQDAEACGFNECVA